MIREFVFCFFFFLLLLLFFPRGGSRGEGEVKGELGCCYCCFFLDGDVAGGGRGVVWGMGEGSVTYFPSSEDVSKTLLI